MGRRPGGFPRAELAQHRAGGVIYHVHETAVGGAIFQPGMKAGVQLHPFAEMRLVRSGVADPAFARAGGAKVRLLSSSAAGSRRPLAVRFLLDGGMRANSRLSSCLRSVSASRLWSFPFHSRSKAKKHAAPR